MATTRGRQMTIMKKLNKSLSKKLESKYVAPRPRDHDLEVIPTMLDEENFHGNDLAGGEGEVPIAIMRETDPVVRREVHNARYNLGHPSTATLLRIMRRSGASDAAQRFARWWKCPLCDQTPRAVNPTTAPYRPNAFNSMVGCDVKAIYDADGVKYDALNILDVATGFQMLAILDGPSSTECAEKLWLWWVLWAGPPKMVVSGLGTSFRTAFIMMVERYGASSRTAPIESPWQISMVERHGGVNGEVIAMIVHSSGIRGKKETTLTTIAATAAKNRRPGLHSHSPRSAAFGMDDRPDGSVMDSLLDGEQLPMHSQAASDARYQRAFQIRQDAMKAIVDFDHSQGYHRAIAMRPRLEGPHVFFPGAQVFYWQAQGAAGRCRGRRRRQFDRWRGPGTVFGREMRDGQERGLLGISLSTPTSHRTPTSSTGFTRRTDLGARCDQEFATRTSFPPGINLFTRTSLVKMIQMRLACLDLMMTSVENFTRPQALTHHRRCKIRTASPSRQ